MLRIRAFRVLAQWSRAEPAIGADRAGLVAAASNGLEFFRISAHRGAGNSVGRAHGEFSALADRDTPITPIAPDQWLRTSRTAPADDATTSRRRSDGSNHLRSSSRMIPRIGADGYGCVTA
jgi:hypothetical protein